MKILMVCLGNICRSPIAHGILQARIEELGLDWIVDSAGTGNWHVGELPDPRARKEALKNGIDISYQRARHFKKKDFKEFDLILTMDTQNYNDVVNQSDEVEHRNKVKMIMNYSNPGMNEVVPDPYYDNRFSLVYEMLTGAIDKVIEAHAGVSTR